MPPSNLNINYKKNKILNAKTVVKIITYAKAERG